MEEIWKDIPNYEGLYQASNFGKIRSYPRKGTRIKNDFYILQGGVNKKGYKQIILRKNNIPKTISLHRLIAKTFIPNLDNKSQINHIDGNKLNNKVENLEWIDNLENMRHSIKIGLRDEAIKKLKYINCKKINQYDINNNFIKQWNSIIEIQRELKIPNQNISKVCQHKRKTAGGYIWEYANN